MSLPPGFIEELRTRVSLSQVVGRKVTWDARKSNMGKGDYWSPCPFHQEKTASFHVEDRKGFYYCFGCHQKGDAITFVRETENVSFMEAVEILAGEAGMSMPAKDPRAQEKYDRNKLLVQIMEHSVQFYKMQLSSGAAASARDYLAKRNLPTDVQQRFEMGFAPNDRGVLFRHLTDKGAKEQDIVDTGMVIKPDDGGTPFDRFRGRIMFPIRNASGKCIAFGGRAMDPNARAKYLNSPETPLFDKGRSLYNHGPAREAAGKADSLIVAEGYMDVIALAQFGFNHAVAPLGTAITADQLALMWRMHPEPVIALDGDKAGIRAALRLIDLALPLLEAGKSLRFCIMPEGLDPDDLLKDKGAEAMQDLLASAQPMVNLLWQREIEGKVFDSPERKAALDASLRTALKTIKDRSIRSHYGHAVKELREDLFGLKRDEPSGFNDGYAGPYDAPYDPGSTGGFSVTPRKPWVPRDKVKASALHGTKSSMIAGDGARRLRESVILAAALRSPQAVAKMETAMEKCVISCTDLQEIHSAILANLYGSLSEENAPLHFLETITGRLGYDPLDRLFVIKQVREHPYLRAEADPAKVELALKEELRKQAALLGAAHEIKEAEQDLTGLADEGVTWRIEQATVSLEKATRAMEEEVDKTSENAEELKDHLQKLLDDQIWVKKTR